MPEAVSQSLADLSALAVRILSTVPAEHCIVNRILVVKGGDKVARGRIPELGSLVFACRQDPSTVRTKRRSVNPILVSKGGEQLARGRIPEFGVYCPHSPSGFGRRRD